MNLSSARKLELLLKRQKGGDGFYWMIGLPRSGSQSRACGIAGSNPAPATNFFGQMLREQFSFVKAALALHDWRRKSMLRTHQKRSSVAQW
jgi:hypothetical protein